MPAWIGRIDGLDRRLLVALVVRRTRALDVAMRAVTRIGDPLPSLAVAAALILLPSLRNLGLIVALSLVGSHLAVQLLKRTVVRRRPRLPVGFATLLEPPDRFSFPSGHSAAALSVALPISLALPFWLGAGVLGLALLVGISRCYLGVHYPGDVAAGWALAVAGTLAALALPG